MRAVRLSITGRVQGVGYRYWLVGRARKSGLVGWVRNRRDGSVEAHLQGDARAVVGVIELCHQGPPAAIVDTVQVAETPAETVTGFDQRPTE